MIYQGSCDGGSSSVDMVSEAEIELLDPTAL